MDISKYNLFIESEKKLLKKEAKKASAEFIDSFANFEEKEKWTKDFLKGKYGDFRFGIFENIIFPVLVKGYAEKDLDSIIALAEFEQTYINTRLWKKIDCKTAVEFYMEAFEIAPEDNMIRRELLIKKISWIYHCEHEWPFGILYGMDGATIEECKEIREELVFLRTIDDKNEFGEYLNKFEEKLTAYECKISKKPRGACFNIQGKNSSAAIFTESLDKHSLRQIYNTLANPCAKGSKISIMPDVHLSRDTVVGLAMTATDKIVPNIIGPDIGCGIAACGFGIYTVDYEKLDNYIRNNIPAGTNVNTSPQYDYFEPSDELMKLIKKICPEDEGRVLSSIGTLGGGNHFIEVGSNRDNMNWLTVHSGSRSLGVKVCKYHQKKAKAYIKDAFNGAGAYHNMEYMPLDCGGNEYLQDMKTVQDYAELNREVICKKIIEDFFHINIKSCYRVTSVHNYYDPKDNIIRKGAVSAHKGEKIIISFNMRDGSLICKGKGLSDWNYSAPHGAGRLMSRRDAKKNISLEEYKKTMSNIYSTSVNSYTIDESPMAYKPVDEIFNRLYDSVEIEFMIEPKYNFKAGK